MKFKNSIINSFKRWLFFYIFDSLKLHQWISIEKTFQTGSTTSELAQELAIEGIEHRLNFATGHSVLISTSPTTIVYEFILNDAVYGILGITDPQPVLG